MAGGHTGRTVSGRARLRTDAESTHRVSGLAVGVAQSSDIGPARRALCRNRASAPALRIFPAEISRIGLRYPKRSHTGQHDKSDPSQ